MSVEKALAELTEAVEANTAALKDSLAIQEAALAAIGGEKPKASGRGRGGGRKANTKKEEEGEKPKATGRGRGGRKKKYTPDDVREACQKFLDTDDEDAHEDRKRFIKAISSEFDCKPAEVDEDDRQTVIDYLKSAEDDMDLALGWAEKVEDGRKITFAKYIDKNADNGDEGGEGDDDLTG